MVVTPDRIELAWRKCRSWITQASGAPVETYLGGVPNASLPAAMEWLKDRSSDLRLLVILAGPGDHSTPVNASAFEVTLARLAAGAIAGMDANYTAHINGFDLSIHMIFHPAAAQHTDLELVWWGDEAFPDDSDYRGRFRDIAEYWIGLQDLLSAQHIWIGPEAGEPPGPRAEGWVRL